MQKNLRRLVKSHLLVYLLLLVNCGGVAYGCPRFVEFFPDPVDVPDQEGEFIEIRLENEMDGNGDSLQLQFEDKPPFTLPLPRGKRLVLVHDSAYCLQGLQEDSRDRSGIFCALFSAALPNSRESLWRLSAGDCRDSVVLPRPKPGKSLQRVKDSDEWVSAEPSKGAANPYYELGIADCGLELDGLKLVLGGCDSSTLHLELRELFSGRRWQDSLILGKSLRLDSLFSTLPFAGASHMDSIAFGIKGSLPPDEAPANDILDTLILKKSPLVISEIHHCPAEPEPEWVEVYNRSASSLPGNKFRFCDRGGFWNLDSISPYESVVFTKDTLQLREFLGYRDVKLVQVSMGYLNNTAGSLLVCQGNLVLDSVAWDKHSAPCPAGFNPQTGRPENTPGFRGSSAPAKVGEEPFLFKLSSRVVSRGKTPLRVYVEAEVKVSLKLLDSAGREVWKQEVPGSSNRWWQIPLGGLPKIGIAYVGLSAGKFEKLVGILLRP